jgi:hypothetical protein
MAIIDFDGFYEPVPLPPEPVIAVDCKRLLDLLEKELAPLLEPYLFQPNSPETNLKLHQDIEGFFSDQWVVDFNVERLPDNGLAVTLVTPDDTMNEAIDYEIGDLYMVDFGLAPLSDDDIEALLMAVQDDMTIAMGMADLPVIPPDEGVSSKNQPTESIDDILFAPIKQKKPENKDHSVTDRDTSLDDCCYFEE